MIIMAAKGVEQPNLSLLCQSLMFSVTDYWAVQVGLLTPLTSLKFLGCFYFRCVFLLLLLLLLLFLFFVFTMEGGDSEFANFTLPTLMAFLDARSQNVSGYRMPQNAFLFVFCFLFPHELAIFWSATKRHKDTFFPTLYPLFPVIFATATVLAFALLRNSRFNFNCNILYITAEVKPRISE